MGHNTLSVLPRTRRWQRVVDLLGTSTATPVVVSASAAAAERSFLSAANDAVYVEAVRLMLAIPLAARSADFGEALRREDLRVPGEPTLLDLTLAVTDRLDEVARMSTPRTDLGELAARALVRTLNGSIGDRLPGLFDATPGDVQAVARALSSSGQVSAYSRAFFGDLVGETLSYWLDRTLALHFGPDLRFETQAERQGFDRELHAFVHETTRIVKEFSTGWYGMIAHQKGRFETQDAKSFGAVALKKIVSELRLKSEVDA